MVIAAIAVVLAVFFKKRGEEEPPENLEENEVNLDDEGIDENLDHL
ncbi:MAG: hypothetical protein R6U61_03260 [Thermoplasmata archaeon]